MQNIFLNIVRGIIPDGLEEKAACIREICETEVAGPSIKAMLVASVRRENITDAREWASWARETLGISSGDEKYEFTLLAVGCMLLDARSEESVFEKIFPLDIYKNKKLSELYKKGGMVNLSRFVSSPDRRLDKMTREEVRDAVDECLGNPRHEKKRGGETPDLPGLFSDIYNSLDTNYLKTKYLPSLTPESAVKSYSCLSYLSKATIHYLDTTGEYAGLTDGELDVIEKNSIQASQFAAKWRKERLQKAG